MREQPVTGSGLPRGPTTATMNGMAMSVVEQLAVGLDMYAAMHTAYRDARYSDVSRSESPLPGGVGVGDVERWTASLDSHLPPDPRDNTSPTWNGPYTSYYAQQPASAGSSQPNGVSEFQQDFRETNANCGSSAP